MSPIGNYIANYLSESFIRSCFSIQIIRHELNFIIKYEFVGKDRYQGFYNINPL